MKNAEEIKGKHEHKKNRSKSCERKNQVFCLWLETITYEIQYEKHWFDSLNSRLEIPELMIYKQIVKWSTKFFKREQFSVDMWG